MFKIDLQLRDGGRTRLVYNANRTSDYDNKVEPNYEGEIIHVVLAKSHIFHEGCFQC